GFFGGRGIMFKTVELLTLGAAAVIDTVLLIVLLERRNRRFARVPLIVMVAGACLWHAGLFIQVLLLEFDSPLAPELRWTCLLLMILGLFLMPCGMTHAIVRLLRFGADVLPRGDRRHLLVYLPLGAIVPLAFQFPTPLAEGVIETLLPFATPYLI